MKARVNRRVKKEWLIAAIVLAATGLTSAATEEVVHVDPDAYPSGTLLNNAYSEVTLSVDSTSSYNVYARSDSLASTGNNVFAGGSASPGSPYWYTSRKLRVDFDQTVEWVSIDAIGNDPYDLSRLEVHGTGGLLLGTYDTAALSTGQVQAMTWSTASPDIAYAFAFGTGGHDIHLDNLQYVVPEPTTLSLLVVGGCATFWGRRDRHGRH